MSKKTVGKVAPEDSNLWKCNWVECIGGCGLSGNGRCSENGEWDNPKCPKFNKVPSHMIDKPKREKPIGRYLIKLISDSGTTEFTDILDLQDYKFLKHLIKMAKIHAPKGGPVLEVTPWE